jgi:dCTP deaminase
MAFFTSQELEARLAEFAPGTTDADVDCNAITLSVGPEIFITPNPEDVNYKTVEQLSPGQRFILPPNQFAFLLTEQKVKVPRDAMAFISMKATYKLMGLINVSGFHVDPGFQGRLIFSVYNAGPSPVHLQRGMPLFLIWYAALSGESKKHKSFPANDGIPPSLLNKLSGATDSLPALESRLSTRIAALEKGHALLKAAFAGLATAAIGIGGAIYPLFLAPYYKQVEVGTDRRYQPAATVVVPPSATPSMGSAEVSSPAVSASKR